MLGGEMWNEGGRMEGGTLPQKIFTPPGTIDVRLAAIVRHEYDKCRFEVSVSDHVYFLRATHEEEREDWIRDLENTKVGWRWAMRGPRRESRL